MIVDWFQLRHAYGRATDTPGHLAALESGDVQARAAALDHLGTAVLHQGFPDTATAPAIRAVTDLLAAGRAHPDTVEPLLEFLGWAGHAVTSLAGSPHFADDLPDVADAVVDAYPVVLPLLASSPPDRALFRAGSLVPMVLIPQLADQRDELAALVRERAGRATERHSEWIYWLGRLGVDVSDRLDDPDPAVRVEAALAHETDPRSREIILAALAGPRPAGIIGSDVVAAAIRIAGTFDAIAPQACLAVERDDWTGFQAGWGALVKFAFAEPRPPLTPAQRGLVRALIANDRLWDPRNGSCQLVFQQAGLPTDRAGCRRLL